MKSKKLFFVYLLWSANLAVSGQTVELGYTSNGRTIKADTIVVAGNIVMGSETTIDVGDSLTVVVNEGSSFEFRGRFSSTRIKFMQVICRGLVLPHAMQMDLTAQEHLSIGHLLLKDHKYEVNYKIAEEHAILEISGARTLRIDSAVVYNNKYVSTSPDKNIKTYYGGSLLVRNVHSMSIGFIDASYCTASAFAGTVTLRNIGFTDISAGRFTECHSVDTLESERGYSVSGIGGTISSFDCGYFEISNVIFARNGGVTGVLYLYNDTTYISDCSFLENYHEALHVGPRAKFTEVSRTTFAANQDRGGNIWSNTTFTDCVVTGNGRPGFLDYMNLRSFSAFTGAQIIYSNTFVDTGPVETLGYAESYPYQGLFNDTLILPHYDPFGVKPPPPPFDITRYYPAEGSPLIDRGSSCGSLLPGAKDALGNPRIVGDGCDIGGLERQEVSSVEQASRDERLRVWPNPASDFIQISFPQTSGTLQAVELFDGIGRRVAHFSPEALQSTADPAGGTVLGLDLPAGLSAGVYIVSVRFDDATFGARLIIQP